MLNKLNKFLLTLATAIQSAKIYTENHPKYSESVKEAFISLQNILQDDKELVLGIVDKELAWKDEILFDLSQKLKSFIIYLESRDIEKICFLHGLSQEELSKFIYFLSAPKNQLQKNIQDYLTQQGIRHITAGKIQVLADEKSQKDTKPDNLSNQYETSLDSLTTSVKKMLNSEEVDYLDLRFNILAVMENFMGNHHELLNLISLKKKDLVTFIHLLNVSILSMFFSSKLGFSKEDVIDIGISALFHDVGKISISQKIITKSSKLDESEFVKIRSHPVHGAKILLKYKEDMGILPAVVAYEHHLRYDLKGYPKIVYPVKPHIASLIVSICDVYDALSQRRTYKKDYPPNRIYEIMNKGKGNLFDPVLLDNFFKIIGVWPIGSIVSLNDDRIAVVRSINEKDIFSPKVEIISPEQKGEAIDLTTCDKNITASLNPFVEGKKYLDRV
jgi:HD-GYP domain-containing protein (c-di-GMP phosphodiesterase class II)